MKFILVVAALCAIALASSSSSYTSSSSSSSYTSSSSSSSSSPTPPCFSHQWSAADFTTTITSHEDGENGQFIQIDYDRKLLFAAGRFWGVYLAGGSSGYYSGFETNNTYGYFQDNDMAYVWDVEGNCQSFANPWTLDRCLPSDWSWVGDATIGTQDVMAWASPEGDHVLDTTVPDFNNVAVPILGASFGDASSSSSSSYSSGDVPAPEINLFYGYQPEIAHPNLMHVPTFCGGNTYTTTMSMWSTDY